LDTGWGTRAALRRAAAELEPVALGPYAVVARRDDVRVHVHEHLPTLPARTIPSRFHLPSSPSRRTPTLCCTCTKSPTPLLGADSSLPAPGRGRKARWKAEVRACARATQGARRAQARSARRGCCSALLGAGRCYSARR
jgi:hypothetical protein